MNAAQKKKTVKDSPVREAICLPQTLTTTELAHDYYEKLTRWIIAFEESLDDEHEVAVRLVNFGQAVTFTLTDINYEDPALIIFSGQTLEGEPVELIQHVNQISILLMRQEITEPEAEKHPIGFRLRTKEKQRKKSNKGIK